MADQFGVKGLRELGLAMSTLSADMAGKIARQAAAAGAGVVRKDARNRVRKKTRVLEHGIVAKRVANTALTAEYVVTISTKEMKKYVSGSRRAITELEGPTAPTLVNGKLVRKKKLLATKAGYESYGDLYYASFVEFGTVTMPARPFLRPAIESNIQQATDAMAKRLALRLKKAGALS